MKTRLYPALQLTDACNKRCRACLRVPDQQAHKLTFDDFLKYVSDLKRLSNRYEISFQFVTGGEPTIWKNKGKDVADILVRLSEEGIIGNITMPTNGKRFEDKAYVTDLVRRISSGSAQGVIFGLSIADYQENFIDGKCLPLENLLQATGMEGNRVVPITLVTLSSDDDMDRRIRESYPEVFQRITPLAPMGAGEKWTADCPALSMTGSDKGGLGTYRQHFMKDARGKAKVEDKDFDTTDNALIMNRLSLHSHCGQSPFIDDKWHYCLPFRENPDFVLAEVGSMTEDILSVFLDRKPWLKTIGRLGVIETVNRYRHLLSTKTAEKFDELCSPARKLSIAYRGCMICKEFAEAGIWKDIDANLKAG